MIGDCSERSDPDHSRVLLRRLRTMDLMVIVAGIGKQISAGSVDHQFTPLIDPMNGCI